MRREPVKPWSPQEENRLLLWSLTGKPIADFARACGREPGGVRVKLCRLRADPLTRPPEFPNRDAAAPRVKAACGPADTPDGT